MKKKLVDILIVLIILTGVGILLYPTISDQWNKMQQSKQINKYQTVVREMEPDDFSGEWEKARAFNDSLEENSIYTDAFSITKMDLENTEYWDVLNMAGDGVMGYIEIPKINEKLSIYHGTATDILQTGVGHINGTKLPIGGESTHSVLSGHRGLPSAKLFTNLDQMVIGDKFYISILDEILAYEVDQILDMIPKEDKNALAAAMDIVEGEDHVTLLTCTPYGINSHRLLVRGTRVEYQGELDVEAPIAEAVVESVQNYYVFYTILGVAIAIIVLGVVRVISKKKKNKDA